MHTRLFRYLIPTLLLATVSTIAKADIIYGSISSSSNTQLFSINTATNVQTALPTATGLPYVNGLAYDAVNNFLYYRGGTGTTNANANLYRYNLATNVQTQVQTAAFFTSQLPNSVGPATNAAFYNGNYWFIAQSDDLLVRYNPITQSIATFDNIDGGAATYAYNGDIAISSTGILYSSSATALFSVNISSGTPTGFTPILTNTASTSTNAVNRQLAFLANGTLLGYKNVSGAGATPWATISTTTGTASAAPILTNLQNYGDLASGVVAVPEASTLALVLPAFGMIGAVVLRRRKK